MKHIYSDIIVILLGIIVGYFFLAGYVSSGYMDLITAALVGIALIAIQKEGSSIRFIPRLAIGSVIFGIGVFALYAAVFYFFNNVEAARIIFDGMVPESMLYASLSFIAGLLAIVVRGFWSMKKYMSSFRT
jgi:hypothetical protein